MIDYRKLDVLAAERVMGWGVRPHPDTCKCGQGGADLRKDDGRWLLWFSTDKRYGAYDWSPSTSISDAWQLVGALHKRKLRYKFSGYFEGKEEHWASFDDEPWADPNPLYQGSAPTLPLAITIAALRAVGTSDEELRACGVEL